MKKYAVHICGPEVEGSATVNGRTYRWDFHSYTGPCFLDRHGEPLKRQPGEHHPVWPKFNEWLKEYGQKKEGQR